MNLNSVTIKYILAYCVFNKMAYAHCIRCTCTCTKEFYNRLAMTTIFIGVVLLSKCSEILMWICLIVLVLCYFI